MKSINLIFPHQLFQDSPLLNEVGDFYVLEELLFFKQYNFHQQKIAFHRASMKSYEKYLLSKGKQIEYIESINDLSDIRLLIPHLKSKGIETIHYIDVTDNWLEKRLRETAVKNDILLVQHTSPLFLNSTDEIQKFFKDRKRFYQTDFYIHERKKRNILVDENQKPMGGKWSFDAENRKKYPKKKTPPAVIFPEMDDFYKEAQEYVKQHFSENYGHLTDTPLYPYNFESSKKWLEQFFKIRFWEFGHYEDAIVAEANILNHSVLTPMLNIGLISPQYIIEQTLQYAAENDIPINSTEGFVRQIIGWREFIRAIYELKGTEERTQNFWNFSRKIPSSFWTGTTGILPLDQTIKKVLQTGYCHHIERLMVLGNFMLLCEFDPDEVYRWFMELFIDAYDWVMVPNVYGMSQFADGGLMATKPYISGSNYLMKMSNFQKGDWQATWDGLFWRFMDTHRHFFLKNPRLGMLVRMFDKMPKEKKETHLSNAQSFLDNLDLHTDTL